MALCAVKTVFHVCSVTDIRMCPSDTLYDVNVTGTRILLKACNRRKVKRLIYTSTIDTVFDGKALDQITENECHWILNGNPYGRTKALAEKLILRANREWTHHLSVSILRVTHLYGPGDPIMDVMSRYFANLARIGDEQCRFSLSYIENAAMAHIETAKALVSKERHSLCDGEIFNLKDHDYNFAKWYREVLNEQEAPSLYIPVFIVLIVAHIYDWITWILFWIFGVRIGHPIEAFGVLAINSACQEQTFCDDKFMKSVGDYRVVDIKESIRRTRKWRMQQALRGT